MALSDRQRKQLEDLREGLARDHRRVLASPEGRELLEYLKRKFYDGELLGDTPEETAFNLGAREVVRKLLATAAVIPTQE